MYFTGVIATSILPEKHSHLKISEVVNTDHRGNEGITHRDKIVLPETGSTAQARYRVLNVEEFDARQPWFKSCFSHLLMV